MRQADEREEDVMDLEVPPWLEWSSGERVLFHELPDRAARLGSYIWSFGVFEPWRRRTHFIVTTSRLVALRGLASRIEQSIPLEKIQQVTVRARRRSATVWVATRGGALGTQAIGPLGVQQARRFAETVERARGADVGDEGGVPPGGR